jgi:hypothetical protein
MPEDEITDAPPAPVPTPDELDAIIAPPTPVVVEDAPPPPCAVVVVVVVGPVADPDDIARVEPTDAAPPAAPGLESTP